MEIMRVKSKITEIKYLLDEFDSRLEMAKERAGKLRDIAIGILHSEKGGRMINKK